MPNWDQVETLVLGIAGGMIIGGWIATAILESALYKLLSHPTARKMASAAEKFASGGGGALAGLGKFLSELFKGGGEA